MDWNFGGAFLGPQEQMARIGLARAQTSLDNMKIAQMQRMQQAFSQMGGYQQGQSPYQMLGRMAQAAASAGDIKTSGDLYGKQMEILAKQADITKAQAQTSKANLDFATNLLENVHDQASLDQANAVWQQTLGTKSPLAGQAYSPQLLRGWRDQLLAEQGKQTSAQRAAEIGANIAWKKASMDFLADRKAHMQKQEQQADERLAKTKKGGVVAAPTGQESKQATLMVATAFPNLPAEEATQAGFAVASRAKALRAKNPGMDADTAMRKALEEMRPDFVETDKWYGLSKQTKFEPAATISSQAEYDKLPQGAKYIWGGKEYTKGAK